MANPTTSEYRVNQDINAPEIRVVDSEGNQLGILKTADALYRARQEKLDLVEITPQAKPPVCKILDYNKFIYAEKKRAKELAKKNREARTETKELWLRPVTENHDIQVKVRHAKEFLSEGDKVKFTVKFRGRELSYTEQGRILLESVLEMLGEVKVDSPITQSGRQMTLVVAPELKK